VADQDDAGEIGQDIPLGFYILAYDISNMDVSALRKDKYLLSFTGSIDPDGKGAVIKCTDANGNALFGVSETPGPSYAIQFIGVDGKIICEIKESEQTPYMEIYDDSQKLIGYAGIQWQLGVAILNDPSNNSIAVAISEGDFRNFKITKPDGKSIIATISITASNKGGKKPSQQLGQAAISVQDQCLQPLLLLGFIFAIPKLLPQNGRGSGGGGLLMLMFAGRLAFGGKMGMFPGFRKI
jgi:hypothetical protein